MNDIAELLDIISSLGGAASIDDITSAYAKKHKMPVSLIPKGILESTLSPNSTLVRFNRGTGEWALVVDTPFASPNSLTKKVCNSMITETLDTLSTEKTLAPEQLHPKRKQHINDDLYEQVAKYAGGLIIFLNLLDDNGISYTLSPKKPSARVIIPTAYGPFFAYDRKKDLSIRTNIPKGHPLAKEYDRIGGSLYNETNELIEDEKYIYVFFKKECFASIIPYLSKKAENPSKEKFLAADQYQAKRKQTEFLLSSLCVGHSNVTIDTTRVKSTPVLIDNKRVMSIYYRSNAVRIDTVITSKLYRIAKELEAEGLAYQRPSANPYASSGTYAIFVNEKDEETVYKRLLGLN